MEIIGPSDVAYVISLLKNSIDVWRHDINPQAGRRPKPLYTNGENMKRECGKTAWNDDGVQYYENALKKWKRVYKQKESFSMLLGGWKEWLRDVASNVNPAGWTRKDLSRLLATREEGEMGLEVMSGGGSGDELDREVGYDSEDDGAPMIGPGGVRRGRDDDDDDSNSCVVPSGVRRSASERENDDDDDDDDDNAVIGVGAYDVFEGDGDTEIAAAEEANGVARGGRRVIEDDEESDTEEADNISQRGGTKTSGETVDDYQEGDTSPAKNGGDGARNVRVRLFRSLPEDELEDRGDEDGNGGGEPMVVRRNRRKIRRGYRWEVGRSLLKRVRLVGGVQLLRGGSKRR